MADDSTSHGADFETLYWQMMDTIHQGGNAEAARLAADVIKRRPTAEWFLIFEAAKAGVAPKLDQDSFVEAANTRKEQLPEDKRFLMDFLVGDVLVMAGPRERRVQGLSYCYAAEKAYDGPWKWFVLFRIASALGDLRECVKAAAYFDVAMKAAKDPKSQARVRVNLATLHFREGRLGDAISEMENAVELLEGQGDIYRIALGNLAFYRILENVLRRPYRKDADNLDKATAVLKKSIATFPTNNVEGYYNLGNVYYVMSRMKKDKKLKSDALSCFQKGLVDVAKRKGDDTAVDAISVATMQALLEAAEPTNPNVQVARDVLGGFMLDIDEFLAKSILDEQGDQFFLTNARTENPPNEVRVLRRWNSFNPAVPSRIHPDKEGGGYFLRWRDYGIVIDPGFGFSDIYETQGLPLADIDAVFLTHAHADHTADFERMLTFFFERNEALAPENRRQVDIYLNMGTTLKYINWIAQLSQGIGAIRIMSRGDRREVKPGVISVQAYPAFHKEVISKDFALGYKFDLHREDGTKLVVGFPSDTSYRSELRQYYDDCDVLFVHIGTTNWGELVSMAGLVLPAQLRQVLREQESLDRFTSAHVRGLGFKDRDQIFDLLDGRVHEVRPTGEHMGLHGLCEFVSTLDKDRERFFVISEFGTELGYLRYVIADALSRHYKDSKFHFLAGDIGLDIRLEEGFSVRTSDGRVPFKDATHLPRTTGEISYCRESV